MLPRSVSRCFVWSLLLTGSASLFANGLSLFDAVIRHDQKAVLELLKGGANPNQTRADGATPLAWAAGRDDAEIVEAAHLKS